MFKVFVALMAFLVFSGVLLNKFTRMPEPFPEGSLSAEYAKPGTGGIVTLSTALIDETRTTAANGEFPGASERTLKVTIWYPREIQSAPLLVYSHGLSSLSEGGKRVARHLASHGYVVIAPNFPLSNFFAPGGPNALDVKNQPQDISFIIDSALAWNRDPGHALYNMMDPERIGVVGFSLGGLTSVLVAFHPAWRDERVKAAASIAAPLRMLGDRFFDHANVPLLMLVGDRDAVVGHQINAAAVLPRTNNAQMVTIEGGTHTGFVSIARYLRWMKNPDSLGCSMVERSLEAHGDEAWVRVLGTEEQGILQSVSNDICNQNVAPEAMNPLRQQEITNTVLLSYFSSVFAETEEDRSLHQLFLAQTLSEELSDVRYSAQSPFTTN